jgi:hypothetical protein
VITFAVEFGRLDPITSPIAQNLTINTDLNFWEIMSGNLPTTTKAVI